MDIDHRPAIVEEKTRFGDCEIDTIIGQNDKGAILTINERTSGYCWLKKLSSKNAEEAPEKTVEILDEFKHLLYTITGDNGKEFAEHKTISGGLDIDFYFAKPYH